MLAGSKTLRPFQWVAYKFEALVNRRLRRFLKPSPFEAGLEALFALEDGLLVADRDLGFLLGRDHLLFDTEQLGLKLTDLSLEVALLLLGVEGRALVGLEFVA